MRFLVRILLSAFAVLIVTYLLPGVGLDGFMAALILAVLLSVLNVIVKPLLIILTIPLTVFTFGLFLLVINAVIILLADALMSGFYVENFWWALIFSLLLSLTNALLADISGTRDRK